MIFDIRIERCPVRRSEQAVATAESVDAFMREHIGLHPLAKHHGVHFRRMKAIMEAVGFEPVFDPVAYHTTFYPREQAMGLDLDAADPDDVVVTRRTRAESVEHRRQTAEATKDVRSAGEIMREVDKAPAIAPDDEDRAAGRRWTRKGRSRRIKGEIGRKRVP